MNIGRLFFRFRNKLLIEAFMRSLCPAAIVGGGGLFIMSLVYHILTKPMPKWIITAACGVAGVIFLAFFVFVFYPTKRRVARRIDEMGMQERATTLLAFLHKENGMARLQREAAVSRIGAASASGLKLRFRKREMVTALVVVLLTVGMLVLPYDLLAFADAKTEEDRANEQLIEELIEQLRQQVQDSLLSDEIKEDLDKIIDDLEEDLKDTDNKLEQAGKVEDAKDEISDRLEEELTKNKIGEELKKYSLTKSLGDAVVRADTKKVSSALNALENKIKGDRYVAAELGNVIQRALRDSGVPASDALYAAFDALATDLLSLSVNSSNFDELLSVIFDRAEAAINQILKAQDAIETEKEKLEAEMDKIKEEILEGEKKEPGEEQEKNPGEGEDEESKGDGEDPGEGEEGDASEEGDGTKPGDDPNENPGDEPGEEGDKTDGNNPGGSDGSGPVQEDTRVEGFFDPISGQVGYGTVFETYYAQYLKALKAGEVSEELQAIMDRYFEQLK